MQDLSKMSDEDLVSTLDNNSFKRALIEPFNKAPGGLWEENVKYGFDMKQEILQRLALIPKWLPIEQAPKDGTFIMAYDYLSKHPIFVFWHDKDSMWRDRNYHFHSPIKWQPLPIPPTDKD